MLRAVQGHTAQLRIPGSSDVSGFLMVADEGMLRTGCVKCVNAQMFSSGAQVSPSDEEHFPPWHVASH